MRGYRRARRANRKALLLGSHGGREPLGCLLPSLGTNALPVPAKGNSRFPASVLPPVDGPLAIPALAHVFSFLGRLAKFRSVDRVPSRSPCPTPTYRLVHL